VALDFQYIFKIMKSVRLNWKGKRRLRISRGKKFVGTFDDIRPYNDQEVAKACQELLTHPALISVFDYLKIPILPDYYAVNGISSMQLNIVKPVAERILEMSSSGLTTSGLDGLAEQDGRGYLFISNHRDIVLDPALMIYAIDIKGYRPVQIAVGDNLLTSPLVTQLIRANRSFIVRRNLPKKEQIEASTKLSAYIWQQVQSGQSVWIAQREGRAKDGNDVTNPALISMLYLSQRGSMFFPEFVRKLNIVPVSISYEFDPCDEMKAKELRTAEASGGRYEKAKGEDLLAIVQGITGFKGHIHIAFGQPLNRRFFRAKDVARELDRQIIENYRLWPSNLVADELLHHDPARVTLEERERFLERIHRWTENLRPYLLRMYANPVRNKKKLAWARA